LDEAGFSRSAIEGFVQKMIDAPMESVGTLQVHSFLMARHGKLVVEEYFHGFNADRLHDTRSASKSMGATLLGAAMQAGLKISPLTPVYSTMGVAAGDPRKAALNVENLLTMSPGLDCDDNSDTSVGNENTMQNQRKEPNWYAYTLALTAVADPGTKTAYCSASPNLAGGVLARATGRGLDDLFETLLARPLGIKRYALNLMPTRDVYMGGGWQFTARDFIKFGQLMLDKGVWNGKRVLSADYVARASSPL
jgi:CubicO group peptidase (beta-lactamase class C family)